METTAAGPRRLPRRILDTFVAPRRLFGEFVAHTPWVGVLLVSTAVAVLAVLAVPDEFFLQQMEGAVNRRGRPVTITSAPEEVVRWGRLMAMLAAAVAHPLIAFALAGVLTLIFSVLGRTGVTYRQHLALSSHALLIPSLGTLVAIPLQYLTGDPDAQLTLAMLVPDLLAGTGYTHRVLQSLNLFTLWMLGLIGLGVSVLTPRFSWGRAAVILIGGYLALSLVLAAVGV